MQRSLLANVEGGTIVIPCKPKVRPAFDLRIVYAYKLLGSMVTVAGNADRDICVRMDITNSSVTGFCKKSPREQDVSVERCVTTLNVYLLKKGLYHIGTWQKLSMETE